MSSVVAVLPVRWVWAIGTPRAAPHPLDGYVDGIRELSEDDFRAVYEATVDDLVSFAYGMLSDRRTAEDVVQQTFVELVRAAPKIRGDGTSLRAWLFRSVRFGCMDEYRRRTRRPEIPHHELPELQVEDEHLRDHLEPALEAALSSLSKRHRTAVLLRHVAGLDGEEIARVLGISTKAAYSVVARAEERLRRALDVKR